MTANVSIRGSRTILKTGTVYSLGAHVNNLKRAGSRSFRTNALLVSMGTLMIQGQKSRLVLTFTVKNLRGKLKGSKLKKSLTLSAHLEPKSQPIKLISLSSISTELLNSLKPKAITYAIFSPGRLNGRSSKTCTKVIDAFDFEL